MLADATDGADGIFASCAHADDPVSSSPFAAECNVEAQYPQQGLRATHRPVSARGFWGQPVRSLEMRPLLRSAPARKKSAAIPIHELRSAMVSRTQAASGSALSDLATHWARWGARSTASNAYDHRTFATATLSMAVTTAAAYEVTRRRTHGVAYGQLNASSLESAKPSRCRRSDTSASAPGFCFHQLLV
jgi:hypothetical protein